MGSKLLVVRVRKDSNGSITHVMLNNGETYSIDEAISMSKEGIVENIIVKQGKNGVEYYRDNPTSLGDDNFDHIPEFKF